MLLITLQAFAEDHRHGAGVVPADLWDSSELSVPGQRRGGDAHATELPELRPAAARLHDHSLHPQRSGKLHLHMLSESQNPEINKGFLQILTFRLFHMLAVAPKNTLRVTKTVKLTQTQ